MPRERVVLIHQMGKVGSQSIREALMMHPDVGPGRVGNAHRIADDTWRGQSWHLHRAGRVPGPDYRESQQARTWIADEARGIDLITPVREPIARNVSNFFFRVGLGSFGGLDVSSLDADGIRAAFVRYGDHWTPLRWFREELHEPLGIDAFVQPFDTEVGFHVSEHGRFRLLLLRSDLPDACKAAIIAEYLGISPFTLGRQNAARDRDDDSAYRRFLAAPGLPRSYIDWMLESRYARHFYTTAERATFADRWTAQEPIAA